MARSSRVERCLAAISKAGDVGTRALAPVEHARSGNENGAAVAALAQTHAVTAIVAVAGRSRRAGGRAGLLGRLRRRARMGCSGIQGSQVPTHRHCGRTRQPGSYVGACSRRCVEVYNGGECGGCWRKRVGWGSVPCVGGGGVGGGGVVRRWGRCRWGLRGRTADGCWLWRVFRSSVIALARARRRQGSTRLG